MATATIRFEKCLQDSQDLGGDDEHMVSRVFLALEAGGSVYPNVSVDIKQTVGAAFESAPLEVSKPRGYNGGLNYAAFRVAVERYYRSLVGSQGRGIRVASGGDIRMRDNTFVMPAVATFEYDETAPGW